MTVPWSGTEALTLTAFTEAAESATDEAVVATSIPPPLWEIAIHWGVATNAATAMAAEAIMPGIAHRLIERLTDTPALNVLLFHNEGEEAG